MRFSLLAGLTLFVLAALPVAAQDAEPDADPAPGRLSAYYCGSMPSDYSVDVVLLDNKDENLLIKDAFVSGLTRRGVTVREGAPLILTLEIAPVREFEQSDGRRGIIEMRVGQPDYDLDQQGDVDVRGSVWSNTRDSLVGGRRGGPSELAVNRLRMVAALNSRVDGRCLWQGEATHELGNREVPELALALVPPLVGAFGKSVAPTPLDADMPEPPPEAPAPR